MTINGARNTVSFDEVDEVNNPTATYIYSGPQGHPTTHVNDHKGTEDRGRVDVILPSSTPPSWSPKTLRNLLVDVFLPAGYPHSVSEDYLPYQIFDSLQAFSSSIAGLLSARAVLQGVGVGNADASATSALLLHILQDSSGRIATILFAHRVGTALEPECKMYRLAADVFNDLAMILDCLSPMVPAGFSRVTVLSAAGVLRALCGVSGGSSKASLSAHFARWGNLAEVNAKDSSQETIISLIGMLVGSFVVSHITSFATTWIALILLLTLHLSMNYAAVRAVQMTSLNRQRANIVFSALLASDPDLDLDSLTTSPQTRKQNKETTNTKPQWHILNPANVAKQESIFETDGILRWTSAQKIGFCQIGLSLQHFLLTSASSTTPKSIKTPIPLPELSTLFIQEQYILFLSRRNHTWHANILLKNTCSVKTQLKAWMHALLAARVLSSSMAARDGSQTEYEYIMGVLERTLEFLNHGSRSRFEEYVSVLEDQGWDLSIAALETRSGRRIVDHS